MHRLDLVIFKVLVGLKTPSSRVVPIKVRKIQPHSLCTSYCFHEAQFQLLDVNHYAHLDADFLQLISSCQLTVRFFQKALGCLLNLSLWSFLLGIWSSGFSHHDWHLWYQFALLLQDVWNSSNSNELGIVMYWDRRRKVKWKGNRKYGIFLNLIMPWGHSRLPNSSKV